MRFTGIDEAGYGPTLGPLSIVRASAVVDDQGDSAHVGVILNQLRALGADDSKAIHDPADLAPLERVALPAVAWLSGFSCDTAADLFSLLGETAAVREPCPWMHGADALRLPVAAKDLPTWNPPGLLPAGMSGALIQPTAYNDALRQGQNKADLEWSAIGRLLTECHHGAPQTTVVDRLGGRKFYQLPLQRAFPQCVVVVEEERPECSRYRVVRLANQGVLSASTGGSPLAEVTQANHVRYPIWENPGVAQSDHEQISFVVGGERASPLTAVASCIAKYARELHMLLLNRYWCAKLPWMKPTAGYPQDAKRWLHQVGTGYVGAWGPALVRGRVIGEADSPGLVNPPNVGQGAS